MIFQPQPQTWILETLHTAYALGLNAAGLLTHCYWGARLPSQEMYPPAPNPEGWASYSGPSHLTPEEYPAYGNTKFIDPCLKVTFSDGVRDTDLQYHSSQVVGDELVITLQDAVYPLQVELHYIVHTKDDLIERWVVLLNQGKDPIQIERAFSAEWHLPPGNNYRLTHLSGKWADEFQINRTPLTPGLKIIESRRLTTSHHASPWFAVDRGSADETQGEVWFGALAWSGNWKLCAEATDFSSTRINIGLNDWDFAWQLDPDEHFETPHSLAGYSSLGFGCASRLLHDHIRHDLPHPQALHRVLYNSWEATLFNVDESSQVRLAEIAAQMGVELFVLDDGWFHGRRDDHAGLGDWWPDEQKFPNGLGGLIRRVNHLGMDFGLWIEPEMVNPDSDLYRAHPDWVIHFPTRPRRELRNQLILNLARPDVQEYLIDLFDNLLNQHNIAFIKWDMNRNVSEPGWPDAPRNPRELWVRYVQGLYRVWGELKERHPKVIWQSCSGGGGRADLAILRLADQIWTSDNTDAIARLGIQEGFSQIFPANVMEAWVTDAGRDQVPLEFRLHVAMTGSLGIGGNLIEWSDEERRLAAHWIRRYKELRPMTQHGDQYRLHPAQGSSFSAVQYMAKDHTRGALFAFRILMHEPASLPTLHLGGLDPDALYTIEGFPDPLTGQTWMDTGVRLTLGNLQSTVREIQLIGSEKQGT